MSDNSATLSEAIWCHLFHKKVDTMWTHSPYEVTSKNLHHNVRYQKFKGGHNVDTVLNLFFAKNYFLNTAVLIHRKTPLLSATKKSV